MVRSEVIPPLFINRTLDNSFKWGTKKGVYYFLGNVPSHINHALALYSRVGGTFVVLSKEAFDFCKSQNVDVVCLDDRSDLFLDFSTKSIDRTVKFLNKYARVVVYYEIYSIAKAIEAKQIMLTHGNSFKDYYIEWRQKYMPFYDFFAGLGPDWADRTMKAGVPESKILEVGLARSDELLNSKFKMRSASRVKRRLGVKSSMSVVTYMPTWWGPTSVNDIGKSIIRSVSEDYVLIFRPHPSTPPELISEYEMIINQERLNSFYVPEGNKWGISINDILLASDIFIGDMSSVVLDALLTDKPILVAYGNNDRMQDESLYDPIKPALSLYPKITKDNVGKINLVISNALTKSLDRDAYNISKEAVFYGLDGKSVDYLEEFMRSLTQ